MWQVAAVLMACMFLVGMAHAQVTSQFWVITENGNSFIIEGPPPERPPGFDSAPFLNIQALDTVLSLTAGPAPGVEPVVIIGEAGVVTPLPEYHPDRTTMEATIVRDWGRLTDSRSLYLPMLIGDLKMHGSLPYLGPARVGNDTAVDLLAQCNAGPVDPDGNRTDFGTITVSCVNNHYGNAINAKRVSGYGHILDLWHTGRTIVHMSHPPGTVPTLEIMFTCPECVTYAKAYYGSSPTNDFLTRGFEHPASTTTPSPPYMYGRGNLTGLAWDSVEDSGITYWQNGTGGCTPALNIVGGSIQGGCPGDPIEAGTVNADPWQPLSPGWNVVKFPDDNHYIIITDPGSGAKLQVRQGTEDPFTGEPICCFGFDAGLYHLAHISGQPAKAAVVHNTDRHLLVIPYRGSVHPDDVATLAELQDVQMAVREEPRSTPRQIAHSNPADPIYHGFLYDERGAWPPYKVRLVEAEHIRFKLPAFDLIQELGISNYTINDQQHVLGINVPAGPLMDSEIYDIRNDRLLRTHKGAFHLWDGRVVDRPYIQPWLNLQKNPIWETYGVTLPENELVVVDFYATIPVVKPTRLSGTYLSSLPCGSPDPAELSGRLRDAVFTAGQVGGYDQNLISFLVLTDWSGTIDENMMLQHLYQASRTYLDYLDGDYLAGEEIHVPLLGNRPYLCTTIAPNILESQYLLYGLPFGESYISLGGAEGIAETADGFSPGWSATYLHRAGVQSPRDGVLALDVTARFDASVSALGMGDAGNHTTPTGQWADGTILVDAQLSVGETTVDLSSWTIDTYDIAEESYLLDGDQCYGRFVTVPDSSVYIVKTITTSAHQGEHIPVTLNLTATVPTSVSGLPTTASSAPNLIIPHGTTRSDTLTVIDSGQINTITLTLDIPRDGGGDGGHIDNFSIQNCAADTTWDGGTDILIDPPYGPEVQVPQDIYCSGTMPYTHDVTGLFAGQEVNGPWTLSLVDRGDNGSRGGTSGVTSDVTLDSWNLEFTRAATLTTNPICDGTTFESAIIQFLLRTFVIDVR